MNKLNKMSSTRPFYWLLLWVLLTPKANGQDTTHYVSCGMSTELMQSMGLNAPRVGATALFTAPASFPVTAIDTCGKFQLFYEDRRPGAPAGGFADPVVGNTRRNTLCMVLNYIQTVFDLGNIPPGQYLRIHVDTSWSTAKPIPLAPPTGPFWHRTTGICAPYYSLASVAPGAIINGYVYDFIRSGSDPNLGDYHANLRMNFATIGRGINDLSRGFNELAVAPIDFKNDTGAVGGCQYDLYSNLLHLFSHPLGWFSWQDTAALHGVSTTPLPRTYHDTSLCAIGYPKVTTNPFGSISKLLPITGPPSSKVYLLNKKNPPYNYFLPTMQKHPSTAFIYQSELSHLLAYQYPYQMISPGDAYNPVIGFPIVEGVKSRQYTKGELLHFRDVIGLTLNSSFTGSHTVLLNNRVPYCSKMFSDAYNFKLGDRDYAETIPPDRTLVNDVGASVSINLNTESSLHDDDGDPLSVMPGTLVNFRGCGDGGNNHNRLSLSSGGSVITFSPRANFYGRAQFGFNLWDGKEKGAFVLYTIEVRPGSNVGVTAGSNMVVNGNFEEGTELKLKTTAETINNSYTMGFNQNSNMNFGGRFNNGTILSDGHPYDAFSNYKYGTAVRNSFAECSDAALGKPFGNLANYFPWLPTYTLGTSASILNYQYGSWISDGFPDAVATPLSSNNRYQPLGAEGILLHLTDTLKACKRYVLQVDLRRTYHTPPTGATLPYTYPTAPKLKLGFTNGHHLSSGIASPMLSESEFSLSPIDATKWHRYSCSFTYCADSPVHILKLQVEGALADAEHIATTLLDNVSLVEMPLDLSVSIIDSPEKGCNRTLYAGPPSLGCPSISYQWYNASGTLIATTRALAISALDTTWYRVTVNDGCHTASDTIHIFPCACSPVKVLGKPYTTLVTGSVPSVLAPGAYYVPNNLSLSSNTDMNGAVMLIEPNVKISVAPTAKLTIDNAHLFTCPDTTKLWQGIELNSSPTASARIEVRNNTLIEDAQFALLATNMVLPPSGDIINVSNSTFNRNHVDIEMRQLKPASPSRLPISIHSNLFTARLFTASNIPEYPHYWPSTSSLKSTLAVTDTKAPYVISKNYSKAYCKQPNLYSMLGIGAVELGQTTTGGLYQSELVLGKADAPGEYNLFDNHAYGFVAQNSNVRIINNRFINISRLMEPISYSPTAKVENGMAMLLKSDKTVDNRVQVLGSNFYNYVHDCFMGIYSENIASLLVKDVQITSSARAGEVVPGAAYTSESYAGYGMMVHNEGLHKEMKIQSNRISNMNVGLQIGYVNPKAGINDSLTDNFLTSYNLDVDYAPYIGGQRMSKALDVYAVGGAWAPDNKLWIKGNQCLKVLNGILLNGLNNIKCSTNNNSITLWDTLTPASTALQYGIQANHTNNLSITGNTISTLTLSATSDRMIGVIAGANLQLRLCGNAVSHLGRSFEFAKGAAQTDTRWISNTMSDGYAGMRLASDIGDQGMMTDYTKVPPTYWGAMGNRWLGSWVGASRFQTIGVDYINTLNSRLWVKNDTTIGSAQRPTINGSDPAFAPTPYFFYYTGTAGSIVTTQPEASCIGWIMPSLPKGDIVKGVGVSKSLAAKILSDSLGYDDSYRTRQWMNQLSLYELGSIEPELRDSSQRLDSFMQLASASRFAWITNIEQLLSLGQYSAAQSLLTQTPQAMGRVVLHPQLIVTDYSEANALVGYYAQYYLAYLHHLQGQMTATDSNTIAELAQRCPAKDGVVVYKARALQQRLNWTTVFYHDEGCDQSNALYRRVQQPILNADAAAPTVYMLYPNPNKGSFVLAKKEANMLSDHKSVYLKVYNALGVLVCQKEASFVNEQIQLDLPQKTQGVYLLCIGDQQERSTCLRFVLQ